VATWHTHPDSALDDYQHLSALAGGASVLDPFLQPLICRTPLAAIPNLISKVNHDRTHWPFKEKGVYQRWRTDTVRNRLFQGHERAGHLGRDWSHRFKAWIPVLAAGRGASGSPWGEVGA
jgi:hypothetical protein